MQKKLVDLIIENEFSVKRTYSDNDVIISAGMQKIESFYIRKGFVKVYDLNHDGKIKVIGILTADEMFPLIWAFDHPSESVYYYKAMGTVEVESIETSKLKKSIASNAEVSHNAMLQFVYITWDFMERIKGLQMPYTYERLVRLLPYLATKLGKNVGNNCYELQQAVTQEEIAQMIGVTRESISAHMSKTEENGIVTRKGGLMTINLSAIPEEYIYKLWFRNTDQEQ